MSIAGAFTAARERRNERGKQMAAEIYHV